MCILNMDKKLWTFLHFVVHILLTDTVQNVNTWESETEYCGTEQNRTVLSCNYIPRDIPPGFISVHIELSDLDIHCYNTSFLSNSWEPVETMKLTNTPTTTKDFFAHENCFRNLKNLKYLRINMDSAFHLSANALNEATSVKFLSFADCMRLEWNSLLQALTGLRKIPNLTHLDLSKVGIFTGSVEMGKNFADAVGTRNMTSLNLSGMQVSYLNGTKLLHVLKNLQYINVSSMNLNDYEFDGTPEDFEQIKVLDISNMVLPKAAINVGHLVLYDLYVRVDQIKSELFKLFMIKKIIANGTFSKATIELHHCGLVLNTYIPMQTESIIIKDNNFKYIDVHLSGDFKFRNTSISHIDITHNGLEFVNPSILLIAPNLLSIKLSENNLYKMLQTDPALFEQLFASNIKLKTIDISANDLEHIPRHQFLKNVNLEEIILSNNRLQQVDWSMDNLNKLRILHLQYNRIINLDSSSLENLNSLITSLSRNDQLTLKIEHNPLSCSQCEYKPFITWLTKTRVIDLSDSKIQCSQENGDVIYVGRPAVKYLQTICNRKTIILVSSATIGSVSICGFLLTILLLRQRKLRRKQKARDELVINIQHGEGEYEFIAMLSYNNEDEDFVRHYILPPLNNTLQTMTGADRDLVLTGDQHFRPGFMVHNEIASSLDRVSIVLFLITNEFCTSGFCLSELDQAWINRKPMIFMFKDDVEESLMTPIMKTIYKKNVRILWTMEDGDYVLKTTWENVGQALLELIIT